MYDGFDFDLDRAVAEAWADFAVRLAEVVSMMDAGATLRIAASAADADDQPPFVTFTCTDGVRIVAEAAGNAHLGPEFQLDEAAVLAMEEAGWQPPEAGVGDFALVGTGEGADALAQAATAAFRDVYGIQHPAFLEPDQLADVLNPAATGSRHDASFDAATMTAVLPADRAEMDALLQTHLTRIIGRPPVKDADGDFGFRYGSTMVFARTSPDAREVVIFAAVVHDVEGRSRAMEVLSDLNTEARWVRFLLIRDRVFVTMSLFARPFVPAHLEQALDIVSVIGDRIDEELAAKLRGRTTFNQSDTE